MSEVAGIIDELKRAHDGEAWHGPALREVLSDVTPEQAAGRPIANGHTIWELVLHIAGWERVVTRRLEGHRVDQPEEGDFPAVDSFSAEAWTETLARLDSAHEALIESVSGLSDEMLKQTVIGKDYPIGIMLHGVAQHSAYHGGQIGLLKKCGTSGAAAL